MHIAAVMSAARYIINKQGLAGRCAAPVSMFVVCVVMATEAIRQQMMSQLTAGHRTPRSVVSSSTTCYYDTVR